MKKKTTSLFKKIERMKLIRSLSGGLVMIIPVVMIGSFSLLLRSLPIEAYQQFIQNVWNGSLVSILNLFYEASFGMISVFLAFSVGITYARIYAKSTDHIYGAAICSLLCFFIFAGVASDSFEKTSLGPTGMFTALLCALGASALYTWLKRMNPFESNIFSEGADLTYNNAVSVIIPAMITVVVFGLLHFMISTLTGTSSFHQLFVNTVDTLFLHMGRTFESGLLYVCLSSVMWFFGIHGSNVLESVSLQLFTPAIVINSAAAAAGQPATEIVTKTFIDCFVLMGGCGAAICLLLATMFFSRQASSRNLMKAAAFPILFNINELLIFGYPVIFNPMMLIPFVLTPIVCYINAYFATSMGLLPMTVMQVEWTTPIFMSGYLSTQSISGVLMQLINVLCGVMVYAPFVRHFDRERINDAKEGMQELIEKLQLSEAQGTLLQLTEMQGKLGTISRSLVEELKAAFDHQEIEMYYQPQCDSQNHCFGAEALLRWNHPLYGRIYPPLIIKLASEAGILFELETNIIKTVIEDERKLNQAFEKKLMISVNVSAETLQDEQFESFILKLAEEQGNHFENMSLEVTEQMALTPSEKTSSILKSIHHTGMGLIIDDFSMGHTSLNYLQQDTFDMVKLDGGLVKGLLNNTRCRDIISSILYLSQSMGFEVLAEYVENEQLKEELMKIGCHYYQGYLFSPAVNKAKLVQYVKQNQEKRKEEDLA